MPTFQATNRDGVTIELIGENQPTEEDIKQAFLFISQPKETSPDPEALQDDEDSQFSIRNLSRQAAQGLTLGFSDEATAASTAILATIFDGADFMEVFRDVRNLERTGIDAFQAKNPKTAIALELSGGLLTGGAGLAKSAGATTAKQAGKALLSTGTKQAAKTGTVIGGIAGAGFADKSDFFSTETAINTAIGAGTGAVLGPIIQKTIKGAGNVIKRAIGNKTKVFNEKGEFTDDAVNKLNDLFSKNPDEATKLQSQIQKNLVDDGVLTAEQAKRFNLFSKRAVPPTRANITQNVDDFRTQQSLLKEQGPLGEVVAQQDDQLIKLAQDGAENLAPTAGDLPTTNSRVFQVVDDVVSRVDDEVGKAYRVAEQQAAGLPQIKLNSLAKAISDNRGNDRVTGGVVKAAKQSLKNKGLIKAGEKINTDKRSSRVTGDQLKKLTVKEAESIRKELNSLFDSVTPQGKRLIRELKNAIDDDVAKVVGDDVFAPAREAKISFQKLIERQSRNKFDKTKGGFLEDVIDNKIPEEKIVDRLIGGRDDDLVKFKQFLTKDSGSEGVQAWNDVKAQVLRNFIDKATSTQGKTQTGSQVFNGRLFKNEVNKLKRTKKFNELFNLDERDLINDIIEIGKLRIPQGNVQQGLGPTEVAVSEMKKELLKQVPGIGTKAVAISDALSKSKATKKAINVASETSQKIGQ